MNRRSFLTATAGFAAVALNPDVLYAAAAGIGDWTLGFADVEADIAPRTLSLVQGRPPADLTGVLYRNGPAKFHRPGGSVGHWFDGDGMVRRYAIGEGRADLAARFVDTPKRRADTAAGAVVTAGFGTPRGKGASIGGADDVNAANISVMMAGDELWALWESGSAMVMDPATLETKGYKTLRPDLKGMPFLAHPRFEPDGTARALAAPPYLAAALPGPPGVPTLALQLGLFPRYAFKARDAISVIRAHDPVIIRMSEP